MIGSAVGRKADHGPQTWSGVLEANVATAAPTTAGVIPVTTWKTMNTTPIKVSPKHASPARETCAAAATSQPFSLRP